MNMGNEPEPLSDGLVLEAVMPLNWGEEKGVRPHFPLDGKWGLTPFSAFPSEKNERLLRVALLSDEHPPERVDEEIGHPGELQRIESKLDLVLELLAELLTDSDAGMQPRSVRLGARGLEWVEPGQAPAIGSTVVVSFVPDPGLPRPLSFHTRVLEVLPEAQGSRVRVRFEVEGDAVRELLERLIFRHHRRQVAQMRQK